MEEGIKIDKDWFMSVVMVSAIVGMYIVSFYFGSDPLIALSLYAISLPLGIASLFAGWVVIGKWINRPGIIYSGIALVLTIIMIVFIRPIFTIAIWPAFFFRDRKIEQ